MTPAAIQAAILALYPDTTTDTSTADTFFFNDPQRKFPFATIVTHDTPGHDDSAGLDRPGVFRLSLGLARPTFQTIPSHPDPAALDVVMPHPIYAPQLWICVNSPSAATFEGLAPLLKEAYDVSASRYTR